MRKHLHGRRLFAALGILGVTAAVAVGLTVSMVGATDQPSTQVTITATHVHAKASAAATIDMGSLPQVAEAGPTSAAPAELKDLSPLGDQALEQAKQNASANAPLASQVLPSAPAGPSTPGGAVLGWEGLKDSATICSYFGSGCQPPDMAIASDGTNAVQVVNTSIAVYDATTGAIKAGFPKNLQSFFGVPAPTPAGCDSAHGNQPFLSDPRAFYDPVKKRFWVAALQVENAFGLSPSCTFASRYWVAASATNNPTGAWHVYSITTSNLVGSGNSAADYTQMGFNQEAVFIGGNQFNQAGSAYNGAWTLAIPKKKAEAGQALSVNGFAGYSANGELLDTVQPVDSYGSAGGPAGELLVSSFNDGNTDNSVVVWDFSNALSGQGNGQHISGVIVPTLAYAEPPSADNFPSCTNCLETIDNRVSATPVYMHGNVYFTHDSAVNNGSSVNANVLYGVIHPVLSQTSVSGCTLCSTITASTSTIDQNYITYSGQTDDWFGAIQPDREGNIFIGYDYGSTTFSTSPSIVYSAKRATAAGFPDGGFFLRQAANATNNSRWGDYEAVAFEGWNSNQILIAAQYAGANADWATHIDRVKYANLTQQ
jgi:hypothetical protein